MDKASPDRPRTLAQPTPATALGPDDAALLAAILDSTADGLLVVDRHGRIVRWNAMFAAMWRLSEDDLAGGDDDRALNAVIAQLKDPEGFLGRVRALYDDVDATAFDVLEFRDGRVFERYSRPLRAGGEVRGRVWSFRDVTGKHRLERQQLLARHLATAIAEAPSFRDALEVTLSQVCGAAGWTLGQAWVPGGDGRLGCVAGWYAAPARVEVFRQMGRELRLAAGRDLPGRVWAQPRPAWVDDVRMDPNFPRAGAAVASGLVSGVAVPVIADQRVIAVLEFYASEALPEDPMFLALVAGLSSQLGGQFLRRQAEDALREQRDLLASLERVHSELGEGVVVLDLAARRVIHANDAFCDLTGYRREQLLALSSYHALLAPGQEARLRELARRAPGGQVTPPLEMELLRADQRPVPVEAAWKVLDGASPARAVVVVQDLTERRREEAARRAAEEAAREARMLQQVDEMKSRFLNAAAHQLRTPLTPLRLQVTLLERSRERLSPEVAERVTIIGRSVERLARVVDALVRVATLQRHRPALERKAVDLAGLARTMATVHRVRFTAAGLDLQFRVDGPAMVEGDETLLATAIDKLLDNACKFTPRGGRVTVAVEDGGGMFKVRVSNTGPGLTAAQRAQLFQPLEQGEDGPLHGPGLGLYVTRRIADTHGGTVRAEPAAGPAGGTTFVLALPARPRAEDAAGETLPAGPVTPPSREPARPGSGRS